MTFFGKLRSQYSTPCAVGVVAALLLFFICGVGVGRMVGRAPDDSRITLPNPVEQILDAALVDGFLPQTDAIVLNEWMNDRVRKRARRLAVEVKKFTVSTPSDALGKLARGEEVDVIERNTVLAWIAQLRDDEMPRDVRAVLIGLGTGDPKNVVSQRTVAKWMLSGAGRNEVRAHVPNVPPTISPSFPSPHMTDPSLPAPGVVPIPGSAPPAGDVAPAPPAEAPAPAPAPKAMNVPQSSPVATTGR